MDQTNDTMNGSKKFVFHWGYAITLFFIVYISYLVFLVFKSKTIDHSLVMDNYYQHDITYQDHYNKVTNTTLLGQEMNIKQDKNNQHLILNFENAEHVQDVKIHFYRPSDSSLDFTKEFVSVDDSVIISTESVQKGNWELKVSWSDGQSQFYKSENLFIGKS